MRIFSPESAVVAILIVVLLVLIAPAVVSRREQARQFQRTDRIKQIGLSLNQYHDTYQRFPAGSNSKKPPAGRQPIEIPISPL